MYNFVIKFCIPWMCSFSSSLICTWILILLKLVYTSFVIQWTYCLVTLVTLFLYDFILSIDRFTKWLLSRSMNRSKCLKNMFPLDIVSLVEQRTHKWHLLLFFFLLLTSYCMKLLHFLRSVHYGCVLWRW